jgi:hypothetical protein
VSRAAALLLLLLCLQYIERAMQLPAMTQDQMGALISWLLQQVV